MARPSKYKPKYCDALIAHMAQGYSFESFAGVVDVCFDTLYEWNKVHAAFSEAKKRAEAKALMYWDQVYNMATLGYNKVKINNKEVVINPNATLLIFKMKNAFGWKDRQDITIGDGNIEIKIEKQDDKL